MTTHFDSIPDAEDTLIIARLAELFIERSYRYFERDNDCRGDKLKSQAILERKHKMARKDYESMARYVWGAAKQSNVDGAHTPETLIAIICGHEAAGFFSDKKQERQFMSQGKRFLT